MTSSPAPLSQHQAHHPREYPGYRFVYPVISRRSGGVSIGVNLCPSGECTFRCLYCQVDRAALKSGAAAGPAAADIMTEIEAIFSRIGPDGICRLELFDDLPDGKKVLRDIAFSGDGEPTISPVFTETCRQLMEFQRRPGLPPFQLVLITNATLLHLPAVKDGIRHLLAKSGAVWAKLDAGTEEYLRRLNGTSVPLATILANLTAAARDFPLTLQTMFCRIDGCDPPAEEVEAWLDRLKKILAGGGRIEAVQIYGLARRPASARCSPLPATFLETIARRVLEDTGLKARVFE